MLRPARQEGGDGLGNADVTPVALWKRERAGLRAGLQDLCQPDDP